ncbi:MAG: hypothetical protein IKQ71_07715 [Lachnospiraceae bacterium]|nr:hypothetical protein [Lachnospiraceae bacterium]
MRKKTYAMMLSIGLAMSVMLAGCGSNVSTSSEETTTVASSEESSDTSDRPEPPEGGKGENGTPPEKPEGDNGSAPPDMPGGGQSQGVSEYTAVKEYTSDATETGQTYESTGTDENAVLVSNGATVDISNATVTRTSSDSTGGDNSSFYGVGASMLVTDGTLNVSDSEITGDANGGAGIFAYGSGVANVSNTKITTTEGASGGIHVAGGGTLNAENLTVETSGQSSAAIRSDRGGGTMTVKGGTYTSNGVGSPAIYSTADISVSDATLVANGSEGICIEGKNSITLENCSLTSNMGDDSQNDCTWSVILYQSMSGDSEVGESVFSMTDGEINSKNGGLFYTTNATSTFNLKNVKITAADDCEFFLRCTGNNNQRGWGQSGSNGSTCVFNADTQEMKGNVIWDSVSNLTFNMKNGSVLEGAFIDDESCAGSGGSGSATLTIDSTSKWIVTADSTVTTLTNSGTITDSEGKTVTIKGTDGTIFVQGDSAYTVTCGSYN